MSLGRGKKRASANQFVARHSQSCHLVPRMLLMDAFALKSYDSICVRGLVRVRAFVCVSLLEGEKRK